MMKKIFNSRYLTICFAVIGTFLLQSCSEDEVYDVMGSTENKVYLNTQSFSPINLPKNSVVFDVINTPAGSIVVNSGKVELKLAAQCTHPVKGNIAVKFEIDNSMILEGYKAMPQGVTVTLDKTELTIPEGAILSGDSLAVTIDTEKLQLLEPDSYMIPIKIVSVSNATLSKNLMAAYIVVNATESNCYDYATADDMTGQMLQDKSGWSASINVPLYSGSLSDMFNNRTNFYWRVAPSQEFELIVDLGEEHSQITGVRFHTSSSNYCLTRVRVSSSSDGTNWTTQGIANLVLSSLQHIKFYAPINARYLKFDVLGWRSSSQIRVAVFDVYAN